jgi:hypothetical protein
MSVEWGTEGMAADEGDIVLSLGCTEYPLYIAIGRVKNKEVHDAIAK